MIGDGATIRGRVLVSAGWRALLLTALFGSTALLLLAIPDTHRTLFDFRGGLYNAGRDIIHGLSPYQPGFLAHQAAIMRAGGIAQGETSQHAFSIPVYPAPANLAVVPLSLLPFWLAGTLYTLLSVAAMILGLALLGVRDWRCIALALITPRLSAIWFLPLCTPLILGIAAALVHVSPNNTLRTAVLWLVLEIIVSIRLCRTQRAPVPSAVPIVSPNRLPGESGVGALKGVAA